MNCLDVIYFQAELTPDKLALIAEGSAVPYGRLVHGIASAQRRLVSAGITAGQTVGLNITHPIDHFIFACALYRLKATSASVHTALDLYLTNVSFDVVLSDSFNPAISTRQPSARLFMVDTSWFRDAVDLGMADRTRSVRDPDQDWNCRITCLADGAASLPASTTARALEAQLTACCLSAAPDWDRMVSLIGLESVAGFVWALTGLWLGRTVCFADVGHARNLIVGYNHHYLVASSREIEALVSLQTSNYIAIPALRSAHILGQRFAPETIARCLATISSNTTVSYTHPLLGIIAYAAAGRIKTIDGAVGYVAPWVQAEIVDAEGELLDTGAEGRLRVRDRGEQGRLGYAGDDGWIYPGQRAQLRPDNLLILGRTPAAAL